LSVSVSSTQLSLGNSSEDNLQVMVAPLHQTGLVNPFLVVPLRGLGEARVTRVACCGNQMLILMNTGVVVSFDSVASSAVVLPSACVSIACGAQFGAAVLATGAAFVWGKIVAGKEVVFTTASPVAVSSLEPLGVVAASNQHCLFVGQNGKKIFAWGTNADYCLGLDDKSSLNVVRQVEPVVFESAAEDATFLQLGCQGVYAVALNDKGQLFGWGGSRKECRPALLGAVGLPGGEVSQIVPHDPPVVIAKADGGVYWRKKGKWELVSATIGASARIAVWDDVRFETIFCCLFVLFISFVFLFRV
jgi:alpha-tubulin suppressor-like RCC1 family protein